MLMDFDTTPRTYGTGAVISCLPGDPGYWRIDAAMNPLGLLPGFLLTDNTIRRTSLTSAPPVQGNGDSVLDVKVASSIPSRTTQLA
jgi:hypothetical protein